MNTRPIPSAMNKLFLLPLLFLSLLLPTLGIAQYRTSYNDWQVRPRDNGMGGYPDNYHFIRYEAGKCPRHIYQPYFSVPIIDSNPHCQLQVSFNNGVDWEPLARYAEISSLPYQISVGLPPDVYFGSPVEADVTNLVQGQARFWVRAFVLNGNQTPHFVSPVMEFERRECQNYIKYPSFTVEADRQIIDEPDQRATFNIISPYQYEPYEPSNVYFPPVSHWEIAERLANDEELSWRAISIQERTAELGPFVHRNVDYQVAVRPVFEGCPKLEQQPEPAFITVKARPAPPVEALAEQDSACPGDVVSFRLSDPAARPLRWLLNREPEPSETGFFTLSCPQQINRQEEIEWTGARLSLPLELSAKTLTHRFWRRFENDHGTTPRLSARAVFRDAEGFLIATQAAEIPLRRFASAGYVSENHVLCAGGFLPAPLTLQHAQGASVTWQSSADSLNWLTLTETGWTYDPPIESVDKWYRAVVSGGCNDIATSEPARVAVVPEAKSGQLETVYGEALVCFDAPAPAVRLRGEAGNIVGWSFTRLSDAVKVELPYRSPLVGLPERADMDVRAVVEATGCPATETPPLRVRFEPGGAPAHKPAVASTPQRAYCIDDRLAQTLRMEVEEDVEPLYWEYLASDDRDALLHLTMGQIADHPDATWYRIEASHIETATEPDKLVFTVRHFHPAIVNPNQHPTTAFYSVRGVFRRSDFPDCRPFRTDPSIVKLPICVDPECRVAVSSATICKGDTVTLEVLNTPVFDTRTMIEVSQTLDFNTIIAEYEYSGVPLPLVITESACYRARIEVGASTYYSLPACVNVVDFPQAGRLQADIQPYCIGETSGLIEILEHIGDVLDWQLSTDSLNWESRFNTAGITRYRTPPMFEDTWVRARVTRCNKTVETAPVRLNVRNDVAAVGGVASISKAVACSNVPLMLQLTGHQGQLRYWLRSVDNWATAETLSFNANPLSVAPPAGRSSYRALVRNGLCTDMVVSEAVEVEILPSGLAGQEGRVTASPSTACPGQQVILRLEDATSPVVRWEYSDNDWRTVTGNISHQQHEYIVTFGEERRSYRAVLQADECRFSNSSPALIRPKPTASVKTYSYTTVKVCPGATAEVQYDFYHAASGRWEVSLDEGETWNALPGADSLSPNLSFRPESSMLVRRVARDSCDREHITGSRIRIELLPEPQPTKGGRLTAPFTEWCHNEQASIKLEDYEGQILYWLRSYDNWLTSDTLQGQGASYHVGAVREPVSYRVMVGSPLCSGREELLSSIPVNLKPAPLPPPGTNGRIESSIYTVCPNSKAALTLVGHEGSVLRWESSTSNWDYVNRIENTNPVVEVELQNNRATRFRAQIAFNRCYSRASADILLNPVMKPKLENTLPYSLEACANADFDVEYKLLHVASASWEQSENSDGPWSLVPNSDPKTSTVRLNLERSIYLRRVAVDSCGKEFVFDRLSVKVLDNSVSEISGPTEACSEPYTLYGGHFFIPNPINYGSVDPTWYIRRDGGDWQRYGNGWRAYIAKDEPGYYELQMRTEAPGCPTLVSNIHAFRIHPAGQPASVAGDAFACSGQPFTLAAVNYDGELLRWEMKPDRCNSEKAWTPLSESSPTLNGTPLANDEIRCYRAITQTHHLCPEVQGRLFEVRANPPRMVFVQGGVGEDCWMLGRTPLSLGDLPDQTTLNWQYSYNQREWFDLYDQTDQTLTPPIRHPAVWYRAWIETKTCGAYPSLPFLARIDTSTTEKPTSTMTPPCDGKTATLSVRTTARDFRFAIQNNDTTHYVYNQRETTISEAHWGTATHLRIWVEYYCGGAWEETEAIGEWYRDPRPSTTVPVAPSASYCGTEEAIELTLPNSEGRAILRWEASDDGFQQSIQTYATTTRTLRLDPPPARTLSYRAIVRESYCFEVPTQAVEVRYDAPTVGGRTATSRTELCQNESTLLRLTGYEGRVACWLKQTEEEAEPETLFVQTDTLRVAAPERRTSYWAVIASGRCVPAVSEPVVVETVELFVAEGEIEASANALCPGQSATLTWAGHGQVLYWESLSDGQQDPVRIDSQSPTLEIGPVDRSTTYLVSLQAEGCQGTAERSIRITAVPAPAVESLLPAAIYSCPGISELVSYRVRHAQYARWEFKEETDGDWQPLSEGDPFADASELVLRQSGWLRRVALDSCGVEHELTAIQVIASPVIAPILNGPTALCGVNSKTLFIASEHGAGASFRWQRRQEGASWMDVNATGTELTLTGLQPGEYFFRVASRAGNCQSEFSAVHSVVVVPVVQPPALSASLVCAGHALEAQVETYVAGFRFKVMSETGAEATYPGQDVLRLSTADFADAEWLDVWIEYPCGTEFRSTEARRALLYKPATYSTLASVQRVCPVSNRFELSLSGPAPGLRRWESSKDGFLTISQRWFTERATWTVAGMTETTSFRAVYVDETCGELATQPIEVQADQSICEPQQVCPTPQGVWIQTLSSTQAIAHWTAPAQARRVIVEIKPNTPAATQWISFTALDPEQMQLLLDNLRPGTEYVARMKSRCQSSGESEYTQSFTFRTPMSRLENTGASKNGVRAYPNPVSQWLTVELPETGCSWSILNLTGQHLMQGSTDSDRLTLQMERLPAGMYLLRIDVNGRITTLRLSKVE